MKNSTIENQYLKIEQIVSLNVKYVSVITSFLLVLLNVVYSKLYNKSLMFIIIGKVANHFFKGV